MAKIKAYKVLALMIGLSTFGTACATGPGGQTSGTDVVPNPHYKIGNPYEIARDGWYYPAVDKDYSEVGIASWYGDKFHGRLTANGEVFDKNVLTAAHRTLPMPSIAEVQNLDNGRIIQVRVNDRGPFAKGRIIDLSEAAAQKLGFTDQGVARVHVRFVGEADLSKALLRTNDKNGARILESELRHGGTRRISSNEVANGPNNLLITDTGSAQNGAASTFDQSQNVASGLPPRPSAISQSYTTPADPSGAIGRNELAQEPRWSDRALSDQNGQYNEAGDVPVQQSSFNDDPLYGASDRHEIQIGAFRDAARAQNFGDTVSSLGPVFLLTVTNDNGEQITKVMMGPYNSRGDAQTALGEVRRAGHSDAWIIKTSY